MNRASTVRWIGYGLLLALMCTLVIATAPGPSRLDGASTPMTMSFVMMGLGTAVTGFTMHRSPGSSFDRPVLRPAAMSLLAVLLMVAATEVGFLQRWLSTLSLTGNQWAICLGLAAALGAVVELDKLRMRRGPEIAR